MTTAVVSSTFFLLLLLLLESTTALKFLAWNPIFAHSHANFIGKVADTLAEAGHEVVMLSPLTHTGYRNVTSKHARVIHVVGNEFTKGYARLQDSIMCEGLWTGSQCNPYTFVEIAKLMTPYFTEMCQIMLHSPGLLEQLRAENFDSAFGEYLDLCGFGIFHILGIKKYAVTQTMASIDDGYITGVPPFPSFTPGLLSIHGDVMTFTERVTNMIFVHFWQKKYDTLRSGYEELFTEYDRNMPPIDEIVRNASYFFFNTEPLVDFPRIVSRKMVDIGGIAVPTTFKPLKEPLSSELSLRRQTVFISFGSVMRAHLMPENFKRTIRTLALSMPNVTFIWKYEIPEDNIAAGIPNLITHTWVPQTDLLRDKRLSLFVGHGGAGSAYETALSGVPTVTVPVMYDQMRNAEMLKRLGIGRIVNRDNLANPEILIEAVRDVLENDKYRSRARRVSEMIAAQPQSVRARLVSHFEFMAKFGPLDQLDHAGKDMGVVQFYNIDIFALFATVAILFMSVMIFILRTIYTIIPLFRISVSKSKKTQ